MRTSAANLLMEAGDVIAEILGISVASHADGENFSEAQIEAARRAILLWHRAKHEGGG